MDILKVLLKDTTLSREDDIQDIHLVPRLEEEEDQGKDEGQSEPSALRKMWRLERKRGHVPSVLMTFWDLILC
ncbi:unnamed protein product [Gadus morhua 'NCC']